MIVLLICAVVLFSVKNSFTSPLMVKLDANSDPALMPASENDMMTSIGGKSDQGYTLFIHRYMYDSQNLILQYSIKKILTRYRSHNGRNNQSSRLFKLDPSTIQAVPGIATDPGVTLAKKTAPSIILLTEPHLQTSSC
ncbi:DUF4179 domain-containing protein [Paenibacillus rhizoplanae]